jgi:hypothetical protein
MGSCRILGYFRYIPAGLIFSGHQRSSAILIASPLVDAHRRPLDRYRKSGLTVVKNAFASGYPLEMSANGFVLMIQMLLEKFRKFISATPGERIND